MAPAPRSSDRRSGQCWHFRCDTGWHRVPSGHRLATLGRVPRRELAAYGTVDCDRIAVEHVQAFEAAFLKHMKGAHAGLLKEIVDSGYKFEKPVEEKMHAIAEAFTTGFTP